MRLLQRACLLWLLCCSCGLLPAQAQELPQRLTQAHALVTAQGQDSQREVVLPYAWDDAQAGQQGVATFDLHFEVARRPHEPWAIFLPRVGNAYEIWLNGVLLQRQGDMQRFGGGNYAKLPRYVTVPPELIVESNRLRVRIRADASRHAGLSEVLVGLQSHVLPLYEHAHLDQVTFTFLASVFSLVVGVFALVMWFAHHDAPAGAKRRRKPAYLLAALAELCWAFALACVFVEEPPLPWPLWGVLPVAAAAASAGCMVLFCIQVAGWAQRPVFRWFRSWLFFLMCAAPLSVVIAVDWNLHLVLTAAYVSTVVTHVGFAVYFLWLSQGREARAQRMIALAVLVNVLAGLRDLYVCRFDPSYLGGTWLRYASMLFGLTLVLILLAHFLRATALAHDMEVALTSRVTQKENELNSSYARLEFLARAQERTEERSRILRDMHDGVGAHLSVAMRQLESEEVSRGDVLDTLRESMDRLKLSIDAINLPHGDVTALLANIRYRLEPRLEASGIALHWNVDRVPLLPHMDNKALVHLQFMVYEALSNVLQHAQAHWLRIEASAKGSGISLRLVDNGRGFDTEAPLRKGLLSMRDRAHAIGADLYFRSQPGLTEVEIVIH
jgi:signal transduction histidine kinase